VFDMYSEKNTGIYRLIGKLLLSWVDESDGVMSILTKR